MDIEPSAMFWGKNTQKCNKDYLWLLKTLIFMGKGDNTKLENRRYLAEILPIKRKPLSNQSKKIRANPKLSGWTTYYNTAI